jgi:hypothetical protein
MSSSGATYFANRCNAKAHSRSGSRWPCFANSITARELGLDLGEQTLNAKGAGLHGCWSSRAQRLSCREQPGLRGCAHSEKRHRL